MLNFWLHLCAKILCDNKTIIVEQIKWAIEHAEEDLKMPCGIALPASRPATGEEKFDFVREKAAVWLSGKQEWIIDTVVQILVAWVKRRAAA